MKSENVCSHRLEFIIYVSILLNSLDKEKCFEIIHRRLSLYLWHFTLVKAECLYLVVTLERFEVPDEVEAGGRPHPLDGLPGGHDPYVLHFCDRVQEQLEPLLVVRCGEPGASLMNAFIDRYLILISQLDTLYCINTHIF